MVAHRRPATIGVLLATIASSLLTTVPADASHQFPDVADAHPFHAEISWMGETGISTGYPPDGAYRPQLPVSREAFAALTHRFWVHQGGWNAPPAPDPFPDVTGANPFADDIAWLAAVGVTNGYDDGRFHPDLGLSRQGLAAMLERVAEPLGCLPGDAPDPGFIDVEPGDPFAGEIALLAHWGITTGYPDGGFHPLGPVNRAQVAAFYFRLDGLLDAPDSDCGAFDIAADGAADFVWWDHVTDTFGRAGPDGPEQLWDAAIAPGDSPQPTVGDYDGNGVFEPATYDAYLNTWYSASAGAVAGPDTSASSAATFELLPVPGDYDGDGTTDPTLWDENTATWYFTDGIAPVVFGVGRDALEVGTCGSPDIEGECFDVPVPGDYDGDSTTDLAVWSPLTGTLTVQGSAPVGGFDLGFPMVADFDGDGTDDLAIWDPWTRTVHGESGDVVEPAPPPGTRRLYPADYTGDGRADLLHLDDTGHLVEVDGTVVVTLPSIPPADEIGGDVAAPPSFVWSILRLTFLMEVAHNP